MSITPSSSNPFETARRKLIARLLAMKAPGALPSFPMPCDFGAAKNHLIEAAGIFDEWLAAIGGELDDNTQASIDMRSFRGAFTDAVDGNASYAFEQASMDVVEEHEDMLRVG